MWVLEFYYAEFILVMVSEYVLKCLGRLKNVMWIFYFKISFWWWCIWRRIFTGHLLQKLPAAPEEFLEKSVSNQLKNSLATSIKNLRILLNNYVEKFHWNLNFKTFGTFQVATMEADCRVWYRP